MTLEKWKWRIAVSLSAACTLTAVPAIAQSRPADNVVVVNGTGQPVPTAAQGTTNVAGTVNIGNAPNVNVANTPGVTVTNTPTVSLAGGTSVSVTSALDGQGNPTPLAVLEAVQPYEDVCAFLFNGNSGGFCRFQTIPAGKRLVIQEFDAGGNLEPGLKPITVFLLPNSSNAHYLTATFMGTSSSPPRDYFATHQETRLYTAPNGVPLCSVTLTGVSNLGDYGCLLSGFLVDVP